MAQAPAPAVSRREEERSDAKKVLRIRVLDNHYSLAVGAIPLGEKMAVLRETHMSFDSLMGDDNKIGEVSIAVAVWLARRAAGERSLGWQQFVETWPTGLGADDMAFEVDDGEPEAYDPSAGEGDNPES